jgi:hypothetical protein
MGRFYKTNIDATLEVVSHLEELNFEEFDAVVVEDNDEEGIKIVIDKQARTYWQIDDSALKTFELILKSIKEDPTELVTLEEVKTWS